VAISDMSNDVLFRKVRDLHLPEGKYAIFGSGPMGVRGIRECHDIDMVVTEDLWDVMNDSGWEVRPKSDGSPRLLKDEIEVWNSWKPGEWDVDQLIRDAEVIDGLPFVTLESVLKWKRLLGREKDIRDIEMIEKFLRT
jgi:hypothetical protein